MQNTLQNLGQNFGLLFQMNNEFGQTISQPNNEDLKDIYVRINNLME